MRITTSRKEIIDITKAWLAITVAFAIVLRSGIGILESLLVSAIAVGLGFLLHELGHKIVAQYYRCFAEFSSGGDFFTPKERLPQRKKIAANTKQDKKK